MTGWQYRPRVRIAYADGPDTVYVLDNTGGGGTGAKQIKLRYVREAVQRTNIVRGIVKRDFGRRIEVDFSYEITTMSEEATFVDIFNAACRDDATVYLSLDGGTTEEAMVPPEDGGYTWTPLARKNSVGILVEMTLITARTIAALRPILAADGGTQWA